MSLFFILNAAKDFTGEVAAKIFINHKYQRFGQMTNIQINSTAKNLHVELELKGESTSIFSILTNCNPCQVLSPLALPATVSRTES
jgi:hypothetical protein